MADSMFVPKYVLDLVPENDRQAVADSARNNFFLGLFGTGRGFGAGLLAGNQLAQKSVLDYLEYQDAARKRTAAQNELGARGIAASIINPDPTLSASAALAAPDAGRVGPTADRAALVGAPNPAAAVPVEQRYRNAALDPRVTAFAPDFAKTLATIANDAGPKYEFVNGVRVNTRNPNQAFIPKMAEGEEPVYDARGQIIGIRNMQGAIQALGERQATTRAAEARYQFEQVFNPTTGQREFVSRERLAGGAGAPGRAGGGAGSVGGMISDPGPLEGDLAKQVATSIGEGRTKAEAALGSLRNNQLVEPLLKDTITGPLANERLGAARILQMAGIGDGSVAATQTFMITKARSVLDLVKNLGAGVSISNADLKFAEKVAAGDITLDAKTLRDLIAIENKYARLAITGHNRRVDQAFGQRPTLGGVGRDYFRVEMPDFGEKAAAPAAPAGGPRKPTGAPTAKDAWGIRALP